jgi:uncharacterized protein YjiS (DUF1127 family)
MSDMMMTRSQSIRPTVGPAGARHLVALLPGMLRLAFRAYVTRKALPELTPRERADIGVSSAAALAEAARLPWDVNPGPRRQGGGIVGAIQSAFERARTRRMIARLEARDLRDIAVSPSEARAEAAKFFWQV